MGTLTPDELAYNEKYFFRDNGSSTLILHEGYGTITEITVEELYQAIKQRLQEET